ncbi:Hypothetical predicted protein [Paramuricea clavata]|uniref:Receptor for retinol uptake STRA6 n=1 Tax=Paramuricea clavata TaxID=317549 RepID=A0A6S7FYX2_PARCT|nr:Hypothetical predicted protein [Paramuricea clavata]
MTPARQYSGIEFYLRKIYNPEKNFKFSTQTVSVVMICSILIYGIIKIVFIVSYVLDLVRKTTDLQGLSEIDQIKMQFFLGLFGSLMAAIILATICCVVSLVRFMENHKNNMLRMFKGDKSFIPKKIRASQFMIGKGLRYPSYQIGYFMWGYLLLFVLFFVICFALYALISYKIVQDLVLEFIKGGGVVVGVAILAGLSLPLASFTVFRDYTYSKDVISVNNRNVYMVFSYFWFFVGLPMGFLSAISRILRAMVVGALMLPRIDHSVMPDGFQQIDRGFNAYICYLHVQTAYRNPILRVFCQILSDETQKNTGSKWSRSAQARARWFLALTLARNPQLASDRKPGLRTPERIQVHYTKHGDVKIKVGRHDSETVRLI